MSGGSLGYFYSDLESHIGDFGDRELDELVKDLANLFYAREWFLSGDTCEGNWVEKRDAFKEKWFTEFGRKERVEQYLSAVRDEVMEMLGKKDEYCVNCRYWTAEKEKDSPYGLCENVSSCLMHRHESCGKFEKR